MFNKFVIIFLSLFFLTFKISVSLADKYDSQGDPGLTNDEIVTLKKSNDEVIVALNKAIVLLQQMQESHTTLESNKPVSLGGDSGIVDGGKNQSSLSPQTEEKIESPATESGGDK